jgi:hypothetical protein
MGMQTSVDKGWGEDEGHVIGNVVVVMAFGGLDDGATVSIVGGGGRISGPCDGRHTCGPWHWGLVGQGINYEVVGQGIWEECSLVVCQAVSGCVRGWWHCDALMGNRGGGIKVGGVALNQPGYDTGADDELAPPNITPSVDNMRF